jgi:hypothetical protein
LVMSSASTRPASLDFCPVSMASRAWISSSVLADAQIKVQWLSFDFPEV